MKIVEPPKKFLFGHFSYLRRGRNKCLYDAVLKLHNQFGPNIKLNLGFQKWIIISDPVLAKEVFVKQHKTFVKGKTLNEAKAINIGRKGLTLTENELWRQTRSLYAKYFTTQSISATTVIANDIGAKAVHFLSNHKDQELFELANRLAFSFIVKVSCDYDTKLFEQKKIEDPIFSNQEKISVEFLKRISRTPLWKYLPTVGNFRVRKTVKNQREYFYKLIKEYKEKEIKSEHCILNNFLNHSSDKDFLIDNVWTVLGAAYESTATALHWYLYEVSQRPDVLSKILKELKEHCQDDYLTELQLKKCSFFQNSIMENLRLHTPFCFIARETNENINLKENNFSKGDFVFANLGAIHINKDYWGEDALEFKPDRFDDENIKSQLDSIYAPFGYGPRKCIGQKMSLHEMAIILAIILKNFDIDTSKNGEIEKYHQFTLVSLNGIQAQFHKRKIS